MKGQKCGGLYKLKEENSVRDGVSRISLDRKSSRDGASRKTVMRHEPDQSVAEKKNNAFG